MTRMLELFRFGWRLTAFVLVTVVLWSCFELEGLLRPGKRRIERINRWVPRWARTCLRIYNVQVEARGPHVSEGQLYPGCSSNGIGRVFVLNHCSGIDIPILLTAAEAHAISRHDLADWPLIGTSARRVGTLFVDRESRRSGASVLKEVDRTLASGEGVAMFPEGTSYPGDEVRKFRSGAFNAARRSAAEIVPVGIAYGNEAAYYWNESFMDHARRLGKLKVLRVAVEVGEPLTADGRTPVELIAEARQQVQALVDRARSRLGAEERFTPEGDSNALRESESTKQPEENTAETAAPSSDA